MGLTNGLLTSTDATGQDGERNFDAALAAPEMRNMTIVAHEHFNNSDVSASAQMTRVKATGAQVLIVWVSGAPFGTALPSYIDTGLDIPVLTTNGNGAVGVPWPCTNGEPKRLGGGQELDAGHGNR